MANNIIMKRFFIFLLLFFLFIFSYIKISSFDKYSYLNLNDEEKEYIKDNDIDLTILEKYQNFDSFDLFKFNQYENIRKKTNSYIEALNIINNPHYYSNYLEIEEAIFNNTFNILINKHYYVTANYQPNNLELVNKFNINYIKRENEEMLGNSEALKMLEKMFSDAKDLNFNLYLYSAFRTYSKQEYLYYVVNHQNDNYSARPGHSEHHSGLAFDISTLMHGLSLNFQYSLEYEWLIENSYKYGFILRYPELKEDITLYKFEPWHFRYVGVSIATYIYNNNLTLEEYIIKNYEL